MVVMVGRYWIMEAKLAVGNPFVAPRRAAQCVPASLDTVCQRKIGTHIIYLHLRERVLIVKDPPGLLYKERRECRFARALNSIHFRLVDLLGKVP